MNTIILKDGTEVNVKNVTPTENGKRVYVTVSRDEILRIGLNCRHLSQGFYFSNKGNIFKKINSTEEIKEAFSGAVLK